MADAAAPLLATRGALVTVLKRHVWVGHMTHRAECDCNWRAPSGPTITGQWEHAVHVADALASAVRDPATLADDRRVVDRVVADQKEAADSWGAPLPGSELNMRARTALRALAAALTEDPS